MSEIPVYTKKVGKVVETESEYIRLRRARAVEEFNEGLPAKSRAKESDLFPESGTIGLSFSGGGLRSATFNLGVVQALAKHGVLPFVDYLSTVSGGGYLGSSLTSLLNLHRHSKDADGFCEDDCEAEDHPEHGDNDIVFPFSTQYRNFPFNPDFNPFSEAAASGRPDNATPLEQAGSASNMQLAHMRRSGNFLIQRLGLLSRDFVRTIGAIFSGIFYSVILFVVALFLFASVHYVAMGTLVPGITGIGIPTSALLNSDPDSTVIATNTQDEGAEAEEPSLLNLYDNMVAVSFEKYDAATQTFEPAPPRVYRWAIASGTLGSLLWVIFIIPYYGRFEKRRKASRKASNEVPPEKDPDIPVLWLTAAIHFILIMGFYLFLRITDSDSNSSQLYWIWYPFFYIAATAASGYLLFYIFSLKPLFDNKFFKMEHDLAASQRSIFYAYVGIQTQGAILIGVAALLAIPHYFTIVTPTAGVTIPGGAAIISGLWAYLLQRRAQSAASGKNASARLSLSFSTIKLGLNLLVMIVVLSSIYMIEVLFEQVNLGDLFATGAITIPVISSIVNFFYGLTQNSVSVFGLSLNARLLLIVGVAILGIAEYRWFRSRIGKLVREIARGTYYKNGFRLLLIPLVVLLMINLSYNGFFVRHTALVGLVVFGVLLYLFLLFSGLINANSISLHYFYRDRIADAFLKTDIVNANDEPLVVRDNRSLLLASMNHEGSSIPYHLVMGAVSLQGSKDLKLKGRKTAPFTFSKYYCGSDITGYVSTRKYRRNTNKLARAVTISGAAFSSSVGILTFFGQAFMLTLINVRLGMWLKNPSLYSSKKEIKIGDPYSPQKVRSAAMVQQINRLQDSFEQLMNWVVDLIETWAIWPRYLFEEATGSMNEDLPLVNVTDGGHFENMGLYPLLQRRCKLIISGDASADPEHSANDLARVVRQINVDENIDIDINLNSLKLGDGGTCPFHYTVGRITYHARDESERSETGYLIYIKPSMTGDEPIDITNYWRANKKGNFPHQSTADQFYDEHQFEAYRHLGEHSVDSMIKLIGGLPTDLKKKAAFVHGQLAEQLAVRLAGEKAAKLPAEE